MLIGLYSNPQKDIGFEVAKSVEAALRHNGLELAAESLLASALNCQSYDIEKLSEITDILIVIGGDGTIIKTAKTAAIHNVPVLGINKGRLGFLAEAEITEVDKTIRLIKEKKYRIERRSLLCVQANGKTHTALNEILLHRTLESKIIGFEVYVDDTFADAFSADGFMVSTPTGSTAYSLSAGGPILSPNIHGFVMNSLCSHSLHARPIVVSDEDVIRVKAMCQKKNKICITVDGDTIDSLEGSHEFLFKKSDLNVQFIRTRPNNFYSRLFSKLNVHIKR